MRLGRLIILFMCFIAVQLSSGSASERRQHFSYIPQNPEMDNHDAPAPSFSYYTTKQSLSVQVGADAPMSWTKTYR
jgi:hypothetical protein